MGFDAVKDHGGVRVLTEGGGERESCAGKGRFDLLPTEPLLRLARHYENGARKYTTDITVSIDELDAKLVRWCTCERRTAIPTGTTTPKACAEAATRSNSETETQPTPPVNEATLVVGPSATSSTKKSSMPGTSETQETGTAWHYEQELGVSPSLDSHWRMKKHSCACKGACVGSVEEVQAVAGSTLTMTTAPSKSVGCSAGSATRASDCSEMIQQVLNAHSPTCRIHQLQISALPNSLVRIFLTGDRNWEKGLHLSRFLDSAFRHLIQFMAGDRSEDHLAALMWNIAGYIQTEKWVTEGRLPAELADVPWSTSTSPELKKEKTR